MYSEQDNKWMSGEGSSPSGRPEDNELKDRMLCGPSTQDLWREPESTLKKIHDYWNDNRLLHEQQGSIVHNQALREAGSIRSISRFTKQ